MLCVAARRTGRVLMGRYDDYEDEEGGDRLRYVGSSVTCCSVYTVYAAPSRSPRIYAPRTERTFKCDHCGTRTEWRAQDVIPKKCWACGAPREIGLFHDPRR